MSRRSVAALAVAAFLIPAAALAQAWQPYSYADQGFAVQLPAAPSVQDATFTTPTGQSAPMKVYAEHQDGIDYSLRVIDLSALKPAQADAIAWAERALSASGKVTVAIDARINRAFGRELSITGADGGRSAVAIFFLNNKLYELIGRALPPNAAAHSGDAVRFQQSLQFVGGQGGGFGGPGAFGGQGRGGGFGGPGRRGGGNPQAAQACVGKAAGDKVQLDTPEGAMAATCVLVARPDRPPGGGFGDRGGPPPPPPGD
jgi:hypothetical protein